MGWRFSGAENRKGIAACSTLTVYWQYGLCFLKERETGSLNVSISTVQKWEAGEKKPAGASLKLLNLVKRKGVEVLFF